MSSRPFKGPETRTVDLGGKTLLPGFIDAHSHYISALMVANQVQVYAPPSGPGKDVDSIIAGSAQCAKPTTSRRASDHGLWL